MVLNSANIRKLQRTGRVRRHCTITMSVPPLVLLGKRCRSVVDPEEVEGVGQQPKRPSNGGPVIECSVATFRILRQPGDGACLFHALGCLSRPPKTAAVVRAEIIAFLRAHGEREVQGIALSKWIYWESRLSMAEYCARMSRANGWGGAIEISVYSLMNSTPVEVYERRGAFFRRIAHVVHETATEQQQPVVHLLYSGRSHYDAMKLASTEPSIELIRHHQGFPRLAGSRV